MGTLWVGARSCDDVYGVRRGEGGEYSREEIISQIGARLIEGQLLLGEIRYTREGGLSMVC